MKSFVDFKYAIIILTYIKRAKNGAIDSKYPLNKMGVTGNCGVEKGEMAMLCHREMAGLLDFAHEVWYATIGILT